MAAHQKPSLTSLRETVIDLIEAKIALHDAEMKSRGGTQIEKRVDYLSDFEI